MASTKSFSSKKSKASTPLPHAHKLNGPTVVGNQQYVPEPPNEKEKDCIYRSQVLIPVFISGVCHAMLGPLPNPDSDPDRLKIFFPTYSHSKPIGAGVKPKTHANTEEQSNQQSSTENTELNLIYLNNARIFRTCPWSKDPSDYLAWLAKIEPVKADFWKEIGIFDLIQLSKV